MVAASPGARPAGARDPLDRTRRVHVIRAEPLQASGQRLANHPQEQRAHAVEEALDHAAHATRPTPGNESSAELWTSSTARAVQQRVLVRMQAAADRFAVPRMSRKPASRASSCAITATSRHRRCRRPDGTRRCAPGRRGNPRPAMPPSRAACCGVVLFISASVSCVLRLRQPLVFPALAANRSCRRRDSSRSLSRTRPAGSWPATPRAILARDHQGQRQSGLLQEGRMPTQPCGHFMRAKFFVVVVQAHRHSPLPACIVASNTKAAWPPMDIVPAWRS